MLCVCVCVPVFVSRRLNGGLFGIYSNLQLH